MNPKIQCDPSKNHLFEMKIKKKFDLCSLALDYYHYHYELFKKNELKKT